MKNYMLIATILLISFSSMAQKDKILGKWVVVKETRLDTTDIGRDVLNESWEDYKTGKKVLDPQYIVLTEEIVDKDRKWTLSIKKEKDYFRAKAGDYLNQKVVYDLKTKNYWTMTKNDLGMEKKLIIKLDDKNTKLVVIDPKLDYTVTEYERIK